MTHSRTGDEGQARVAPGDIVPSRDGERSTTRRSPWRALAGWLVILAAGTVGAIAWLGLPSSDAATTDDEIARGAQLYQRNCAVCHAHDGSGIARVAPAIAGDSGARIDLSMRTGRMPLSDPLRGIRERTFSAAERRATMAYLVDAWDLEWDVSDPPAGDAAQGQRIYAVNCAQCHGAAGGGGVAGDGVQIPPVIGVDETTIAMATRVGPFAMPQFSDEVISDQELGHIVAFLDEDVHPANSPLGLKEVGELEAIFFAALLTATVVLVCLWAAGVRGRRPAPPPSAYPAEEQG